MKPFEGIRVLDLTHVLAGPFCTFQLATLGADVIKIEPVDDPDMTRSDGSVSALNGQKMGTYFLAQSSGKRCVALDLKTSEGQEVLSRLVRSADVLVQNYTGPASRALGLDYPKISKINPNLIYCSMTGFGLTGPKKDHPAYDVVIQAWSGLMTANGWNAEDTPLRVGPPVVDYGTGSQAATAISAALFQRTRTGKGQFIDVAMADAALMLMSAHVTETLATGISPRPHGNTHPKIAGYSAYQASDSLLMIGAYTARQNADLMRLLGFEDRANQILQHGKQDLTKHAAGDEGLISDVVKTDTADRWETVLNDAHIPAARVRDISEFLMEPQTLSRNSLAPSELSLKDAPEHLPLAAYTYGHDGPALNSPASNHGDHTCAILTELGYSPVESTHLLSKGVIYQSD